MMKSMITKLGLGLILVISLSAASVGLFTQSSAAGASEQYTRITDINEADPAQMNIIAATPAADKVIIRKARKEEIGKKTVCPVTGESFTVTKATDVAEYKGKTYYLCCDMCAPQFKATPDKFVKK